MRLLAVQYVISTDISLRIAGGIQLKQIEKPLRNSLLFGPSYNSDYSYLSLE